MAGTMNNRDAMKDMWDDVEKMRQEIKVMVAELKQEQEENGWGEWESHVLKWPMKLNGKWYWRGDTVYRKEKMRYLTGSGIFTYGDEFDILREKHDNT